MKAFSNARTQPRSLILGLARGIVQPAIIAETRRNIDLRNAAGRIVVIKFGADPDVEVTETLTEGARPIVSMEIKGGSDASNIHHRLGEAEKSHQKAKRLGFCEFWTLVRVDVSAAVVRAESPTTTRVFNLDRILDAGSEDHRILVQEFASRVGLGDL